MDDVYIRLSLLKDKIQKQKASQEELKEFFKLQAELYLNTIQYCLFKFKTGSIEGEHSMLEIKEIIDDWNRLAGIVMAFEFADSAKDFAYKNWGEIAGTARFFELIESELAHRERVKNKEPLALACEAARRLSEHGCVKYKTYSVDENNIPFAQIVFVSKTSIKLVRELVPFQEMEGVRIERWVGNKLVIHNRSRYGIALP